MSAIAEYVTGVPVEMAVSANRKLRRGGSLKRFLQNRGRVP